MLVISTLLQESYQSTWVSLVWHLLTCRSGIPPRTCSTRKKICTFISESGMLRTERWPAFHFSQKKFKLGAESFLAPVLELNLEFIINLKIMIKQMQICCKMQERLALFQGRSTAWFLHVWSLPVPHRTKSRWSSCLWRLWWFQRSQPVLLVHY